jgi:hypothetical protein
LESAGSKHICPTRGGGVDSKLSDTTCHSDEQEFCAKLTTSMCLSYIDEVECSFLGSRGWKEQLLGYAGRQRARGVASIGFGADGRNDAAQSRTMTWN